MKRTSVSPMPNKDILGTAGKELAGRLILLGVTGSPGAVQSVELARELMRHGAEVIAVMSGAAQELIHPNLLEWATGNSVVTELTGKIEHILYTNPAGRRASLYLLAPCTGNTIGKIASGIDDTTVTSAATAAIGEKIPVLIAPAMHDSMWVNPFVMENLRKLRSAGIEIIEPRLEEGKAKIADTATVLEAVLSRLSKRDMRGMGVLITAGPTFEYIDPIRLITNRSSGRMGVALARIALRRGARVTLVYGPGQVSPPSGCKLLRVETTEDMLRAVEDELRLGDYDIAILSAAVSDFAPIRAEVKKISSHSSGRFQLSLKPTRKILDLVKKVSPDTFLVAFKAEHNLGERELIDRGFRRLRESGADLIAVNDVALDGVGFGEETNEVLLVDRARRTVKIGLASKDEVAERILDEVRLRLRKSSRRGRAVRPTRRVRARAGPTFGQPS